MEYIYHFNNLFKEPLICDKFAVYQVGELMASGSTIVTDHFQYCYEITYVVSGRGESVTDGIASPLSGGDCYLSFTDEWHRISSDKQDPLRYRFAGFTSEDPQIIAVFNELKRLFPSPGDRKIYCPECEELFLKLLGEMNFSELGGLYIGALLTELLLTIMRARKNLRPGENAAIPAGRDMLAYRISFYVENNIFKIKSLNELTDVFHFSYQYISAVFYKVTGTPLHVFFISEKIKAAKHLLESGRYTVTKIAEMLNYSCTHVFSRMFKKYTGITPKKYALQHSATDCLNFGDSKEPPDREESGGANKTN